MNKVFATTAAALLLGSGIAIAAEDEPSPREKAVKYRQAAMTLVGANFKPMGAMVKGEVPYDAAAFTRHAEDLAAVASIDILRGFPPDSEGPGSDAKGEIWFEWDDFKDKMAAMKKDAQALAKVAASGDKGAIKKQFLETADGCKACHKKFKQ